MQELLAVDRICIPRLLLICFKNAKKQQKRKKKTKETLALNKGYRTVKVSTDPFGNLAKGSSFFGGLGSGSSEGSFFTSCCWKKEKKT